MPVRIKKFIKGSMDLIRPFTLLAPIIVSICIMLASLYYTNKTDSEVIFSWTTIIIASLSLAILNGASNALNQITDLKTDSISKPYRPIPQGIISIKTAAINAIILYMISLFLSIFVNITFTLFILLIVFFTVSYSIPPRLKDKIFFNQLWVAIPRGFLGILASWCVFGNAFHPLPTTIGFIAMIFLIGGSITKDITDSVADKKTGTKTLINTYGIKKAALFSLPFMLFPFIFIPIMVDMNILDSYLMPLTLLAIPSFFIFYLMVRDSKKVKHFENTSSWALMYVTYFFFAFGFSLLTIIGTRLA